MPSGGRRTPAPTPSTASRRDLTLVPASARSGSSPPSFASVSPVAGAASVASATTIAPSRRSSTATGASRRIADGWGDDGSVLGSSAPGGRSFPALNDREARRTLFRRCDVDGTGAISQAQLAAGVLEEIPDLYPPRSLGRAFVAADVSRNGLVSQRELRLLLEYLVYFRELADTFDRLESGSSREGHFSFDEFVDAVDELLPDGDYDEAQLRLNFSLIDKDHAGYISFADLCSWAAKEHLATKGGDAGAAGSPRVAYVRDGEPLNAAATGKNWRDAVRFHWMASVRLPLPEMLPESLRVGKAQAELAAEAEAETEAKRRRSTSSTAAAAGAAAGGDGADRGGDEDGPVGATAHDPLFMPAESAVGDAEPQDGSGFTIPPNKAARREVFDSMDTNRSRNLTLKDYTAGLNELWPGLYTEHPESVRRAFATVDPQGSGVVWRDFKKLLAYTLFFNRYRAEFDAIDEKGDGLVRESDFKSACERTGVAVRGTTDTSVSVSDQELNAAFAALDRHEPASGQYRSGYIHFDEFSAWSAKQYLQIQRQADEEARMLVRSKQRGHTTARSPSHNGGAARRGAPERDGGDGGRRAPSPVHHRGGHGGSAKAWERQKGREGADTFYNVDRSPGQEWAERRHSSAFNSTTSRFSTLENDTPAPGTYCETTCNPQHSLIPSDSSDRLIAVADKDEDSERRRHGRHGPFTAATMQSPPAATVRSSSPQRRAPRREPMELAPSSPLRAKAQGSAGGRGRGSTSPSRAAAADPNVRRTRRTWCATQHLVLAIYFAIIGLLDYCCGCARVRLTLSNATQRRVDEHEVQARETHGESPGSPLGATTAHRYRPASDFDDATRRGEKGAAIGRAGRWCDQQDLSPGPGHYGAAAHEAWVDPDSCGKLAAPGFGSPHYELRR